MIEGLYRPSITPYFIRIIDMHTVYRRWTYKITLMVVLGFLAVWPMGLFAMQNPVIVVERDTSYNPDIIMIEVGQIMEVRNRDEFWHSSLISKVDENGFEKDAVFKKRRDRRGGQWEFTFKEAGAYVIRCTNHDGMSADIQVVE